MKWSSLEQVSSVKSYIILALIVTAAFAYSLQNSFVWDDYGLIVDNPKIALPIREIPTLFISHLWKIEGAEFRRVYYRPMVMTFHILNYKIWGPNPWGFHLTNILLHMICVVILYRVGLLLFSTEKLVALIGASVFAVHPVNNEPVGRAASGEVIFGFFVILSLYFFLKEKKYLSWITFFLALLSKEVAVMMPFALLILTTHKKGLKKGMFEVIPYAALVGIYLVLRVLFTDTVLGGWVAQPILTRTFTMAVATLDYVRLLVIPYPLSAFYPARWYTSIFEPKVLLAALLFILGLLLAFKIRKDKAMFFLLIFPFIMLAPVIWRVNTFTAGRDLMYIAERFLYIPALSFSLFVSAYFVKLTGDARRKYLMIGWVLVIIIFAAITISSNMIWKNNITLFEKIVEESPNAAFAHQGLGDAYKEIGKLDDAMNHWLKALESDLDNPLILNSVGNAYYLKGDYNKAINAYKMAIRVFPQMGEVYYNLAITLEKAGRKEEAKVYYKKFIKLAPESYRGIISELREKGL